MAYPTDFKLNTTIQTLTWVSSLLGCPRIFYLVSPYNQMSQFLKINPYIYIIYIYICISILYILLLLFLWRRLTDCSIRSASRETESFGWFSGLVLISRIGSLFLFYLNTPMILFLLVKKALIVHDRMW